MFLLCESLPRDEVEFVVAGTALLQLFSDPGVAGQAFSSQKFFPEVTKQTCLDGAWMTGV